MAVTTTETAAVIAMASKATVAAEVTDIATVPATSTATAAPVTVTATATEESGRNRLQ